MRLNGIQLVLKHIVWWR